MLLVKRLGTIVRLAAGLMAMATGVLAAPYDGDEFTYYQPDGSAFAVRLYGDEFYAAAETLDGYAIARDPATRFWCYAERSADGASLVPTSTIVGQGGARSRRPKHLRIDQTARMKAVRSGQRLLGADAWGRWVAPEDRARATEEIAAVTVGDRIGIVLLAQFPDRPGDVTISQAEVDAYCNEPGFSEWGNHGSVFDYFTAQSQGRLRYNCIVTAYYTAQHDRDYYTDPNISYGTRARELIIEGLDLLKDQGFDFTRCDGDGDGRIDGVNAFYAGSRVNSWAEGLWPHKSGLSWGNAPPGISSSMSYQITDMTTQLRLGTFVHENGHMICGFPDLYDYGGESNGAGRYSLMASSGSTAPVNVDAYLKSNAGWCDITELDGASSFRGAVRVDSGSIYRYLNPADTREYFVVYVRENNVGYETGAPDEGLIIWHIDELGSNNNEQMTDSQHYKASAEQSDGQVHLERDISNYTDDLYHQGNQTVFSDATLPDAHWWTGATGGTNGSGQHSGFYVHSVSDPGEVMTFVVGTGVVTGPVSIGLDESLVEPRAELGGSPPPDKFAVWNRGGGTLSYTVTNDVSWLSCSTTTGTATTEADLVTMTYDTAALAPGAHTATVTVTDPGADNSPQTITVQLTVHGAPGIALSTTTLSEQVPRGLDGQQAFEVSNGGDGVLNYGITVDQSWLSVTPGDGTVLNESDTIYVDYSSSALETGEYAAIITVADPVATNTPQTIDVTLTVLDHGGHLSFESTSYEVAETAGMATITVARLNGSQGQVSVDFGVSDGTGIAGQDYVATNGTLTFADGVTNAHFEVEILDDTDEEQAETVNLALTNPSGDALLLAPTTAVLTVHSDERPQAAFPFFEDFESGGLVEAWMPQSTGEGRVVVTSANTPHSGSWHVTMDSANDYALNELDLSINLTGQTNVILGFWHKEFSDEDHTMGASFSGHTGADGVAVSEDGTNWFKVQGLTSSEGISSAYQYFEVELDPVLSANGLNYGEHFKVRFQQYDNYGISTDGFAFDDIRVSRRHAITATSEGPGAIAPTGTVEVFHGSGTNYVMTPDPFYGVLDVEVDGVSIGPATTYAFSNVTSARTIHAVFGVTPTALGVQADNPTNVAATSAELRGQILSNGAEPPEVYMCWGRTDAGTAGTGAWDNAVFLGTSWTVGDSFSLPVAGLAPNAHYYSRCYVTNSASSAWSTGAVQFITGELAVEATTGVASESGPTPGLFTITRPANCVTGDLTVAFLLTGTALPGVDYQAPATTRVIPDGLTSVPVSIDPLPDRVLQEGTETVELQLLPGNYALGVAGTAVVHLDDDDFRVESPYSMAVRFTGYDGADPLTNFPALVLLSTDLPGFAYDQFTSPLGYDLRFTDGDEVLELYYEVERWDPSGESAVWVQTPELIGTDTVVRAFWGNGHSLVPPSYTTNGATWSEGYAAVWHLETTEVPQGYLDSSGSEHHGFGFAPSNLPGITSEGVEFDGSSDYIAVNMFYDTADALDELTVSVWFKTDYTGSGYNGNWAFVDFDRSEFFDFYVRADDGRLGFSTHDATADAINDFDGNTAGLNDGQWHFAAGIYDGNDKLLHLDGAPDGSFVGAHGGMPLGESVVRYGILGDGSEATAFAGSRNNQYYDGMLDEVRISHVVRSPDWLRACWLNLKDNSAFASMDSVQTDHDLDGIEDSIDPDDDNDDIPDWWEDQHGLDARDDADRDLDQDGDGHANYQEYVTDTIPTNSTSYFRVMGMSNQPTASLYFMTATGRLYDVHRSDQVLPAAWSNLTQDVPGTGQMEGIDDPAADAAGFYRVDVHLAP